MEKRLIIIILIIGICSIIPLINAGSIGISPAKYSVFFEPGLEKTFTFRVSNSDPERMNEIYVRGDLSEYVNLSKTIFNGEAVVEAKLKLPMKIEKPGGHRILIGAREMLPSGYSESPGIGGLAAIQAPIDVFVPYPGKYMEAKFIIPNINENANASYIIELYNLGTENISVKSNLKIFHEDKLISENKFESINIFSKDSKIIKGSVNTAGLKAGLYKAVYEADYGKEYRLENEFKIGSLYINITSYSYKFFIGEVSPYYIEIENLWNNEIKNVYAIVSISENGKLLNTFKPSFVNIGPWEKNNLTSFFDATNLKEGRYIANLNIYYEGANTNKLVAIYIQKRPVKPIVYYISIGIIVILLIIFLIIFYLFFKVRKLEKRKVQDENKKQKRKKNI
jgi:hypothetical protein